MNTTTDLVLIGALAAVWLAAGLLADSLPVARTARELRRRARALSTVVGAGAAVFIAVPVLTGLLPGESDAPTAAMFPAVPALLVLLVTGRRLMRIRRGADVFAAAPHAPAPPALRAAAAHPWVAVPLQVTGLAALVGVPIAADLVKLPGTNVSGIAISMVGIAVVALVLRHAIRHSRLNLAVLAPLGWGRQVPAPIALRTERYKPLPEETPRAAAAEVNRTTGVKAVDLAA
ncbi:hypothetical protein [Actinoplanes sp. NPDC051494]|uniref:hypothetical protein n=1 Tax=Actinoplanes sp. NPDC051494 TaxID=3363907 RepID=UPI0037991DF3